jgi:Domain of unknown function (DUF4412)
MTRALAAVLCLAAVPALAFEGVIDTKMTMNRGKMEGAPEGTPSSMNATGQISVKGLNSRMEQQMSVPGMGGPGKTVVIHRAAEPTTTYILHESNKTYSKITSDKGDRDESEASKWTVKKLGKDTVAGRSTEHVQVQRAGGGDVMEVWIDKNLVSAGDLEKAFNAGGRDQGGWWAALRKEGAAGIPLKVISKNNKGETTVTWEATSVKSQSVPDSAFAIPAGYTESKGFGGMSSPGDTQQRKEQMMQQLSPEQRKQVEEMMKKYQEGGK